jgi:hypothetical protein
MRPVVWGGIQGRGYSTTAPADMNCSFCQSTHEAVIGFVLRNGPDAVIGFVLPT